MYFCTEKGYYYVWSKIDIWNIFFKCTYNKKNQKNMKHAFILDL